MEDFLLMEPDDKRVRYCKVWTKIWESIDDQGHLVTNHTVCNGVMEKTIISESPKITMYKCAKCGNKWRSHNGLIYPCEPDIKTEVDEFDLYQDEIFEF